MDQTKNDKQFQSGNKKHSVQPFIIVLLLTLLLFSLIGNAYLLANKSQTNNNQNLPIQMTTTPPADTTTTDTTKLDSGHYVMTLPTVWHYQIDGILIISNYEKDTSLANSFELSQYNHSEDKGDNVKCSDQKWAYLKPLHQIDSLEIDGVKSYYARRVDGYAFRYVGNDIDAQAVVSDVPSKQYIYCFTLKDREWETKVINFTVSDSTAEEKIFTMLKNLKFK